MGQHGTRRIALAGLASISALALCGCRAPQAAGARLDGSHGSAQSTARSTDTADPDPLSDVVTPGEWRTLATDTRVTLHLTVHHYPVRGSTPRELMRSMARTGPEAIGSRRAIGGFQLSAGDLGYWLQPGRRCSVTDPRLSVQAAIWLPRWAAPPAATARTRTWWHDVARDIREHEQEHAFIALTELRAVPALLEALPGRPSCQDTRADVRQVLDVRWRAAQRRNREFDDWTHNGTTGPYWLG